MTTTVSALPASAVVIAHGPTGHTLTALGRLRSAVGDRIRLVVIGGTEPGLTAVDRASERGYAAVPDHGPDALARLLRDMAGPVLVVHDDVTLTPHSVVAMMLAHGRTGLAAVPGGRRGNAEQRVEQHELTCVIGQPEELAELAERSAFGPGMVTAGRFVVAPDTEVTHAGECRHRFADGWGEQNGRPLLVAGLIVRDEAPHIPDCLGSLDGVVDRIEVIDTGSVDDTVAVALAHGANVTTVEWRDDFAWARNQAIERCADAELMLWIDADERFRCADPDRLRRTLRTFLRLYPAYRMEIRNLADERETHRFAAVRLVRPAHVRFEGAIHERPRPLDGSELLTVSLTQCHIDHLGYARSALEDGDKVQRNLRIAEDSYRAEPTAERAVHYARALAAASADHEATLAALDPLLEATAHMAPAVRAMLLGLRAKVELDAGQPAAAVESARSAVAIVPADLAAGAALAEALVRLGRHDEALDTAAELRLRPSPDPLIIDHVAATTRARSLFDAAVAAGRADAALAQIADLAPVVDPWSAIGETFGTATLLEAAALAGARGDGRCLVALAARADVTADDISVARDRFVAAGGTVTDDELVPRALADLERVDAAPRLRERFAETDAVADAVAYADALATGHIDLTIELETAIDDPNGAALALGVAAEALSRRCRPDEAAADAVEAAHRWPGAMRAAVIVARAALDQGRPDIALDMVAAARDARDQSTVPRARRHDLDNCAVAAHLATGDLAAAVAEALNIVDDGGVVEAWPTMLRMGLDDTAKMTLVLGLALLSDGADFLGAAAATLRPDKTAELCLAYLVSGGSNADAVSTGIVGAVIRGRTDLATMLADHAGRLDRPVVARLIDHARDRGAVEVAARLEAVCAPVPTA